MPTTKTITLYTYDELSPEAQEKAREWYREGGFDYEWWDSAYEDIKQIAEILGIEFMERGKNGISLFFRLAYSQGDGSSFDARYRYAPGLVRKITRHVKGWKEDGERLIRFAIDLRDIQKRNFYKLSASINSKGDSWIGVDVESDHSREVSGEDEQEMIEVFRSFNRWIYNYLRSEYESISTDEAVAETIRINEYTFTENGKREI